MQIIINLSLIESKRDKQNLLTLLSKLEKDGYQINDENSAFIFDNKTKNVIDCLNKEESVNVTPELVDSLFEGEIKLAIIFVDEKYVRFTNSYFPTVYCFIGRNMRPLLPIDVINNYIDLLIDQNKNKLENLYSSHH